MTIIINPATGVTEIAGGNAQLPALVSLDDHDTGIWFPGPNTIAISTGAREALRVDNNGNVGISSNPTGDYRLEVDGKLKVTDVILAPTISAPAYIKGGIYFDTTLNKLRVGGATDWETITSI